MSSQMTAYLMLYQNFYISNFIKSITILTSEYIIKILILSNLLHTTYWY